MTNASNWNASRWIGKRTRKGLVIREINKGVQIGQWFVRTDADGAPTAPPQRMTDHGFRPCMGEAEARRVLFFANRHAGA